MSVSNIYMQEVTIYWTKATRGIPGAALRNQCAICYALSPAEVEALAQGDTFSLVSLREATHFVPEQSLVRYQEGKKLDWSTVSVKQPKRDDFVVRYQYINFLVGAPDRSARPALSCPLEPGQLVRVEYNGRFAEPGANWYYVRHIFNLVRTDTPTPELFLAPPAHQLTDLARLW